MWPSEVYIKEVSSAQALMGPLPQSPAGAPAPQSPEPDQGTSTALWMNSPQTEAKEDPMLRTLGVTLICWLPGAHTAGTPTPAGRGADALPRAAQQHQGARESEPRPRGAVSGHSVKVCSAPALHHPTLQPPSVPPRDLAPAVPTAGNLSLRSLALLDSTQCPFSERLSLMTRPKLPALIATRLLQTLTLFPVTLFAAVSQLE